MKNTDRMSRILALVALVAVLFLSRRVSELEKSHGTKAVEATEKKP